MFRELFEFAFLNGLGQEGSSREHEWKNKKIKFVKLIQELPDSVALYLYGSTYYLAKNDQYIGYVEVNSGSITKSHRLPRNKYKKLLDVGFYMLVLPIIVSRIGELRSDRSLSKSALAAYEKLNKSSVITLKLSNGEDFDKQKLLDNHNLVVVITESRKDYIKDLLEHYMYQTGLGYDSVGQRMGWSNTKETFGCLFETLENYKV